MHQSAGRHPAAFALRVCAAALIVLAALPSLASAGTVFLLDGRGWGHGVGLSQWGAEGYARHGYGYSRILAHYYPHTQLTDVQPGPMMAYRASMLCTACQYSSAWCCSVGQPP